MNTEHMEQQPSQRKLADMLGISPSLVTRYKAAGMPVSSAAAAQAWRQTNLHPGRTNPQPPIHDWPYIIAQVLGVRREAVENSIPKIESNP